MGKQKGANTKKEAGNARKAEQAQKKASEAAAREEAAEAERWNQGSKNSSKKEAAAAKKAEAARKKAERDTLLADEEKNTPGRAQPKNSKTAQKKSRGTLDLSQLDDHDGSSSSGTKGRAGVPTAALNASGIENALDALDIAADKSGRSTQVDRHPERRFAAAYAKFEERRLEEAKRDGSMQGLRLDQRKQRIRKEFDKSDENPFNQLHAAHNADREEITKIAKDHKDKIEARLTNS